MAGLLATMVVGCRGRPEPMLMLTGPEADLLLWLLFIMNGITKHCSSCTNYYYSIRYTIYIVVCSKTSIEAV